MLSIKFQRVGKKHQPNYRIVVAEKRSKLGGPPVEQVGTYDPSTKNVSLEKERILHWLKTGAQPTISIHNLLVRQGVIPGPKIAVKIRKPEAPGASGSPAVVAEASSAAEGGAEPAPEAPKPGT